MTDTEKKIADIRERLEKVTPGPWHTNHGYAYTDGLRVFGNDGADIVAAQLYAEDADFIVHAPDDIRYLLSELDHIQQEYAEERAAHNAHVTELCELEKEHRKLQEEVERYKAESELWLNQNKLIVKNNADYKEQISSLSQQLNKLIEFTRKVIQPALNGYSMDGGDVQDLAVGLGLLREEAYDPDKHGEDRLSEFEPGDPYYVFTDILLPHRKG